MQVPEHSMDMSVVGGSLRSPDEYLPQTSAAVYLGVSERTLARWRAAGDGPSCVRRFGRIFYGRADLESFLAVRTERVC